MIRYVVGADEFFNIIEKKNRALCIFGSEKFLQTIEIDYNSVGTYAFDVFLVVLTEGLAKDLQIVKIPQFKFFERGTEKFSVIGRYRLLPISRRIDALHASTKIR